jgi:hypothetical protein
MKPFTFISCSNIEEGWLADLTAQYMAEQEEHERDFDVAERMAGRCDMCQEFPEHGLAIDGGLALCDECIHV